MQQAASDGQLLLHAARQFSGQFVRFVRNFKFLQQRPSDGLVILHIVNARYEIQMLPYREVVEEPGFIREEGKLPFSRNRISRQIMSANADDTASRRDDSAHTP
jgi:hypothetical protein